MWIWTPFTFYAAVEQRDNPELRGKPVIVGGGPNGRGVVQTCSYEARKYGIHSAMGSSRAYRLCPHAIFVPPRFEAYRAVSNQIREIFHEYTDCVQPISLDEAYLDVTENKKGIESPRQIAQDILNRIQKETGCTASAGVSFNKFLAKVGSDFNKPNGICVITKEKADEFIDNLPIRKFMGVGKVTEKRMKEFGIETGVDF
jgi:DNA polymerase-4